MSTNILLAAIIGALLLFIYYTRKEHHRHLEEAAKERKDLLDRIQAPSYAEYTAKVVREKKAEQPEEKKEQVEYIS